MPPTVAEWLDGKEILITGGTGYMGKVLVEKLLRCCPRLDRLYLIVRTKKGSDAQSRLVDYKKNVLFGPLLAENPNAFDKVTVISGDMSELECGLSKDNQQLLKEKISIVFHTAASVRFDDDLSSALKLNTRGTHELVKIAKEMKKLELFQYVSTTYCNANLNEQIQEKVYPSHLDWKVMLKLLETEEDNLNILVYKLLWAQPNTYTLTKCMAENVVLEASKELPTVIVRPSVVVPILDGPLPGWSDNLNGVIGVTVGVSKGVLRTFKCSPSAVMDYIPVDVAISGMIVAAWTRRFYDTGELQVYNQTYGERVPVTFNDIVYYGVKVNEVYPMENYLWYPFMILTNNTYYYHFLFFFLQFIPAFFMDLVLLAIGQKRMLLRLNIKIYNAAMALSEFSRKTFNFANKNYLSLLGRLHPEDKQTYNLSEEGRHIDILEFLYLFQQGIKKYVFHEKDEDLKRYLKNYRRLYYIDRITRLFLMAIFLWYLLQWGSSLFSDQSPSSEVS